MMSSRRMRGRRAVPVALELSAVEPCADGRRTDASNPGSFPDGEELVGLGRRAQFPRPARATRPARRIALRHGASSAWLRPGAWRLREYCKDPLLRPIKSHIDYEPFKPRHADWREMIF